MATPRMILVKIMHLCVDACIDWIEAGNGRETRVH